MATWPSTLQQRLLARDFSLNPRDNTISSESDYGPAKKRKRYTDVVEDITCSIIINRTQYDTLNEFYKTTLGGGVEPFDFLHPITGVSVKVRFVGPPRIVPLGGIIFKASMNWEILP